jgi:hypothetical protein
MLKKTADGQIDQPMTINPAQDLGFRRFLQKSNYPMDF